MIFVFPFFGLELYSDFFASLSFFLHVFCVVVFSLGCSPLFFPSVGLLYRHFWTPYVLSRVPYCSHCCMDLVSAQLVPSHQRLRLNISRIPDFYSFTPRPLLSPTFWCFLGPFSRGRYTTSVRCCASIFFFQFIPPWQHFWFCFAFRFPTQPHSAPFCPFFCFLLLAFQVFFLFLFLLVCGTHACFRHAHIGSGSAFPPDSLPLYVSSDHPFCAPVHPFGVSDPFFF